MRLKGGRKRRVRKKREYRQGGRVPSVDGRRRRRRRRRRKRRRGARCMVKIYIKME